MEFDVDEEIKETPASLLYDFLYKCGRHALHPSISMMFNCDLSVEETLSCHPGYFEEARQEFDDLTHEDTVMIDGKNYIHFNLKVSPEKKQRLNRDWHKVPSDKKRAGACPAHQRKCRLMEYYAAFLCFLHMNVQSTDEESTEPQATNECEDTVSREAGPTNEEGAEEDTPHVIEEFNDEEERKLSAEADIEALRGQTTEIGHPAIEADEVSPLPTPLLPSYQVGDTEYILLTDIQHVFKLREDHCIAFIAQNLEADDNFVDDDGIDKYLLVDSHVKDTEFLSAAETLKMIYADALKYEGKDAMEEELQEARERLNITNMGQFRDMPSTSAETIPSSSTNLWQDALLEADENQQVIFFLCFRTPVAD